MINGANHENKDIKKKAGKVQKYFIAPAVIREFEDIIKSNKDICDLAGIPAR